MAPANVPSTTDPATPAGPSRSASSDGRSKASALGKHRSRPSGAGTRPRPVGAGARERSPCVRRSWRWKAPWLTVRRSPFAGRVQEVGPSAGDAAAGYQSSCAPTGDNKGARDASSRGSVFLQEKGSSSRRSRPVPARKGCACASRVRTASLAASTARKGPRGSVSGFGPAHARGVETSMGVSTLRFVLQKSIEDVALKEAFLATCGEGERELAPSGRPRRAKGRPKPGRDGKVTGSASASEGHPQGCRGSGESNRWKAPRVVEASLRSREGWGKRSWPSRRRGCESRRGEPAR